MSNHQASEQMLGYLYQVKCALHLLLENDNEQSGISIEKFDDIAFSDDGDIANNLIQTKHHVKKQGDLTDSSVDLWRTINVWVDIIKGNPEIIRDMKFVIITTARAPEESAAFYLRHDTKNVSEAYTNLINTTHTSINKSNLSYYQNFLSLSESDAKKFIDCIEVVDNNQCIVGLEDKIKKLLRYNSLPKYENNIFERLEGWWLGESIKMLCSNEPVFISQSQIRSMIVSISSQYSDDNLPIDTDIPNPIDINALPAKQRIFCEQLKLILVGENRMKVAIRDYYRAFIQRSNWVKDDLLYINEPDNYENKLIDEWEHLFTTMQDDISQNNQIANGDLKVKLGKDLYKNIETKDIKIRPKCADAFVMRGTYHILSNQLKVGWHYDFHNRLSHLLEI